jgi:hypothetical protein
VADIAAAAGTAADTGVVDIAAAVGTGVAAVVVGNQPASLA